MHVLRAVHVVVSACFIAIAAILAIRAWALFGKTTKRSAAEAGMPARPLGSESGIAAWAVSAPICVLLVLGCLVMGIAAAFTAWHWLRNARGALHQEKLTLELHIPNVAPTRTYTIVAKFHVNGRPYVTETPLHVQFGAQKPVYRVALYYDAKNPARNSWTPLAPPSPSKIDQILLLLIGSMVCFLLLLEVLNLRRIRVAACKRTQLDAAVNTPAQESPVEISEKV